MKRFSGGVRRASRRARTEPRGRASGGPWTGIMLLNDLIAGLSVEPIAGRRPAVRICDLTEDSRTVLPGSLFIARSGTKSDGRRFIADAVKAGAVAILTDRTAARALEGSAEVGPAVLLTSDDLPLASALLAERFWGEPSARLVSAAVTGTNGKTTISWLLWQLLNALSIRCGLIGTVAIDDGREVAPADMTTPPAIELSRTLASMLDAGCRAFAMEASSHALDQRRVAALKFHVAIFTNLTRDHLDYHKTMDAYAAAKARLFETLAPSGVAIVNADDPAHARMIKGCPARILRCGIGQRGEGLDAAVRISSATLQGMKLALEGPWGEWSVHVPLIGAYNAMNVLQALAGAYECLSRAGLSANDAADDSLDRLSESLREALHNVTAPPGRLERVDTGDDLTVLVDYAHTDDGLRNALTAVRQVKGKGSLWAVFGCGGDRDTGKRPRMGAAAAELADRVVVTSDNPRTEKPGEIIDAILTGIDARDRDKVSVQADRARAIAHAIHSAARGDVVVIAGKGHETTQTLPDGRGGIQVIHFDDREHARATLRERRATTAKV